MSITKILGGLLFGLVAVIVVLYIIPWTRPLVVWFFSLLNLWFNLDWMRTSIGGLFG